MTSFVARLGWRGRRRAAVLLTTLALTALGLVEPGRAAAQQGWTFTATGTIPGGPSSVSFPVTVQADGSFGITLTSPGGTPFGSGSCLYTIGISGVMRGQTASFTATATGTTSQTLFCTGQSPQTVGLVLNASFPNATSGLSARSLIISGLGVEVRISAQCNSGCAAPGPSPQEKQATDAAKQAAALGSVALTTTSVQTTNIGLRLAALRRGARGVNVSGVSFNLDGQPVPLDVVASVIAALGQGGGASADRASAFGPLGFFLNGQGSFGNQDLTPRDAGFDFHTMGMTAGVDYRLTDQLVLGAAFGYLRTKMNLDASAGDSRINGYSLSAYGSYYLQNFYVDGIATFGWNEYRNERNVADVTAQSHTDGTQFAVGLSTGYDVHVGALSVGPTARVNYARVRIDGYRETGAASFDTRISEQTIESVTSALGGEVRYALSTGWGVFMPQVSFEWEHEYKGDNRTIVARVSSEPTVAPAVRTGSPDRDYANLGAGVTATFPGGVSGFAHYQAVLGRTNFTSHAFSAGVRLAF